MQSKTEKPQQNTKKRRSEAQRRGKFAWLNYKIDRVERRQTKVIIPLLRVITNSLEPFLQVDERELFQVVCKDEVDEAIISHLVSSSENGITPNEACGSDELRTYRLKPYQVTRRIQSMNKKLRKWLGKDVAISVHRRWRLSVFAKKILTIS